MSDLSKLIAFLESELIEFASNTVNEDVLNKYNQCCYDQSYQSSLAIIPNDKSEVIKVVKFLDSLAVTSSTIKLYTISTGNNWGYGSATPSSENAVLMSLHKLNSEPTWLSNTHDKEQPYGKTLGIVKIEPGVSQIQLYNFLKREGGEFWMDATGSSIESSVLGNTLERGFGHTAYGDHFDHCAGLEVVLADGTFVKTGHAGHTNAANAGVHKHGHGPVVEGVMSQSNIAIVTAMYIHVMPAKKLMKKFFIKLSSNEGFYQAVEALRPLKMSGLLNSQMHCANAHKGIQAMVRYPFKEADNSVPLPSSLYNRLIKKHDISPWTISGAIYADSSAELSYKVSSVKKALKSVQHKAIMLSPNLAKTALKFSSSNFVQKRPNSKIASLSKPLEVLNELIGLKQGKPTNYFINSAYYRMREFVSTGNPDADNVGLIWLAPIGPLTRETLALMIETASTVSLKYKFDPALSITLLNEKAADCVISIIFDRTIKEEDDAALKCYDEMLSKFNALGFSGYRSAIRAMQTNSLGFSPELVQLHRKLKLGFDPKDLFGSGHYISSL
mgnify:CR=1 FL=1